MIEHDFNKKLEFSQSLMQNDIGIIKQAFPKCINVTKTNEAVDRTGIDYVAELQGGAKINIDVKRREKGASCFWKHNEPELALETWSVYPDNINTGKPGWSVSDISNVHFILFIFDRSDSDKYYLLPYQQLRAAFINNYYDWVKRFERKKQYSGDWTSEAVFVPASVVIKAINQEMQSSLNLK